MLNKRFDFSCDIDEILNFNFPKTEKQFMELEKKENEDSLFTTIELYMRAKERITSLRAYTASTFEVQKLVVNEIQLLSDQIGPMTKFMNTPHSQLKYAKPKIKIKPGDLGYVAGLMLLVTQDVLNLADLKATLSTVRLDIDPTMEEFSSDWQDLASELAAVANYLQGKIPEKPSTIPYSRAKGYVIGLSLSLQKAKPHLFTQGAEPKKPNFSKMQEFIRAKYEALRDFTPDLEIKNLSNFRTDIKILMDE